MKYIRKFNEGKNITDELKGFCSENLAYLIDGGFHILYSTGFIMQDYYTGVSINKMVDNSYKIFNWHDIRDDVIPFFDILSRKYIVSDITFSLLIKINSEAYGLKKDIFVKLDDIIGDNLEDYDIFKISFKCREKITELK
jgi:hypothetical protein